MARPTSKQKRVKAGGGVVWRRVAVGAGHDSIADARSIAHAGSKSDAGDVEGVVGCGGLGGVGGVDNAREIGDVEVLLVHRRRYDDWSFPKGKLDPDEKYRHGALREVLEETGFHVRLGVELAATRYVDGCGRPKKVRYWAMTVVGGSFIANDEVDQVEWMAIDKAAARLTYPHDVAVLDSFVATLEPPR